MISIKNIPTITKQMILALIAILLAIFTSAIFIIIPAVMLNIIINEPPNIALLAILKQFSVFMLLLFLPLLLKKSRIIIFIMSVVSSIYFCFIYFIIAFHYLTQDIFNPYFLIDSYTAVIPTAVLLLGEFLTVMLFASLIGLFLIFCYLFICLYNALYQYAANCQPNLFKFKYLLAIPLFILPIFPPHQGFVTFNYHIVSESQKAREFFQPIRPAYQPSLENAGDNIFILQLESQNALALQGQSEIDGKKYSDIYTPYLNQIAKDGVFFPYFWSNSIQTDRAQENIICGMANNIGLGFSYYAEANLQTCLPNELKTAGYKTIAFRSDNLQFHNMGKFMKKMGFDEVHYQDIMQPEDTKYKWGYDDCIFYQRAFEYLKKQYPNPNKLFVYFEVSSTHTPWENKAPYAFADKIPDPQTYAEIYLNAQSEQDYCLSKFYEEYKNFNPPKTHLIVLSDTSCPLGINDKDIFNFQNNFNENFITNFLYIPPAEQAEKYRIGDIVTDSLFYAHTDIMPTIYELISGQNHKNSFVYELKKDISENNHENCQILSQPYSGSYIIVINNDNKYLYSIIDKTVTLSNIKTDIWEKNSIIVENNVTFQDFKDKYFCERYK